MAKGQFPEWLIALVLVLATILAYQPVWRSGFIWDDDAYILNNLTLRSAAGLAQIWSQFTATPQYYPIVHTSFWLEYHLWELNPLGYHIVNVLLHALASLLLWRVLVRLQLSGAWLAAAVFALHPVAVESVAWVTERKNVLSAVCYFAAALAYVRWTEQRPDGKHQSSGSRRCYFIAFGLFAAALLSKTVTCSLPAALLLVSWWRHGRITRREVWPLLPFFVAGTALGLVTAWLERSHVGARGAEWTLGIYERFLLAGRALWFYTGKLLWPTHLAFVYPRWTLDPTVWWQWVPPISAVAVAVLLWHLRQRIGRGPLVAVLFFGGTLFPALGFINVYPMRFSFVADHFQYLASVGVIALAAAGLAKVLGPIQFAAILLPLGLGLLTWKQSHIYLDPVALWQDTLAKNPACWMAHSNLGIILDETGKSDEAIGHYQEAIRLKPDYAEAHNNLGTALTAKGQIDRAIGYYQEAVRLKPDYAEAQNNLGTALAANGQMDEAIHRFQEVLRLNPNCADGHYNLGTALAANGQVDGAIREFQEVVRLKPHYADAYNNLGNALLRKGQIAEALRQFQAAARLKPDNVDIRHNLGNACQEQGQTAEAIRQYREAIRLKPDSARVHNSLGTALYQQGRISEAIHQFQDALRLKPDYADARNNLNAALATKPDAGKPAGASSSP